MDTESLIPREVLFDNPDKAAPKLNPLGNYIAYLSPYKGVLNIYLIKDAYSPIVLTKDQKRGIRNFFWLYDSEHIIYLKDKDGDENFHLRAININTLDDKQLTPDNGVRSTVLKLSKDHPNKLAIGLNERNKAYFDVYILNASTGQKELIYENNKFSGFILDEDLNIRFSTLNKPNGDIDIYEFINNQEAKIFTTIPFADITTTYPLNLSKDGKKLYFIDSRESDKSKLYEIDLTDNSKKLIFYDEKADIADIMTHPITKKIQVVNTYYMRNEPHILDKSIIEDFKFLNNYKSGDLSIISRNDADNLWIIGFLKDDEPFTYYLYDRGVKNIEKLFSNRTKLEKYKLSTMHPVEIQTRDNLKLVSYLTIPHKNLSSENNFVPDRPLPLILNVHGGPSVRDYWGLDNVHQWLSNRGYAVLSVNYRGSTGFGKKFFEAGNGQWYDKMHDDLIDAVNWAIENNIADKDKIAIFGGSYGGYASLVGLTKTPDKFACAVDIVGPSNLITLMESIPEYWKPSISFIEKLTGGDIKTEEGKEILRQKSPLTFFKNIIKPLLIGHGQNDPRVKKAESDQIVNQMVNNNIPVIYINFPDEGHGFARPENRIAFYAITEKFLSKFIGGRYEETDFKFKGSSIEFLAGEDIIKQ